MSHLSFKTRQFDPAPTTGGALRVAFGAACVLAAALCTPERTAAQVAVDGVCATARPFPAYPWGTTQRLQVGGVERNYTIRVPVGYTGKVALPVLVVFHGYGMNAALEASFDQLGSKGNGRGFIVVYANGTGPNGETGLGVQGWNYVGSPSRLDDVAYGDALFADLEQRFCVDPEREYIVGHSDGSGFTGYYACQSTRNFAAAAMLSGTLQPATCSAERALPTIHFNGLLDQKVPYNGGFVAGTNVPVAPAEIGVRDWAEQSGCALTPSQTHPLSNLTRFRYADCPAGLEHVLYRVENGGHGWPGSPLSIFTYLGINNFSAANVPASDMILDFFAAH